MMMQGYFCKGDVPYKYAQIQLRDGKTVVTRNNNAINHDDDVVVG